MPWKIVTRREVWTQGVRVFVPDDTPADKVSEVAKDLVQKGEGEDIEGLLEYSHTPDDLIENWTVEDDTYDTPVAERCSHCGEPYTAKDLAGARCLSCGTSILPLENERI